MRREGEGERWLEQAQEDLKWSRALFELGAHHLVAFLSQQIAEKGLKALLYHQGQEAVLGHSVERLAMERRGLPRGKGEGKAVVVKDVPPWVVAVGVPARVIRELRPA